MIIASINAYFVISNELTILINAGQGDDQLTGNGGADKFQCGKGEDTITDYDPEEVDKSNHLIDILNEHEVTAICIQCSIESEINKVASDK